MGPDLPIITKQTWQNKHHVEKCLQTCLGPCTCILRCSIFRDIRDSCFRWPKSLLSMLWTTTRALSVVWKHLCLAVLLVCEGTRCRCLQTSSPCLNTRQRSVGVAIRCSRCAVAGLIQRLHHDVHGRFGEQRHCPKRYAGFAPTKLAVS